MYSQAQLNDLGGIIQPFPVCIHERWSKCAMSNGTKCMKVQIGLTAKTNPNLGEAILVPSQAHLCNTSAKSRAT